MEQINDPKITRQESESLHLWLGQWAHEFNNKGLTLQMLIKVIEKLEVRPNKDNLKDAFVKTYIKSAFGHDSHLQLTHSQLQELQDALIKVFGYHFDTYIPFPSIENLPDSEGRVY